MDFFFKLCDIRTSKLLFRLLEVTSMRLPYSRNQQKFGYHFLLVYFLLINRLSNLIFWNCTTIVWRILFFYQLTHLLNIETKTNFKHGVDVNKYRAPPSVCFYWLSSKIIQFFSHRADIQSLLIVIIQIF